MKNADYSGHRFQDSNVIYHENGLIEYTDTNGETPIELIVVSGRYPGQSNSPARTNADNADNSHYTKSNFRKNLIKYSGETGENLEAHHVFPVKYEAKFKELGINIHDPQYGAWVDPSLHRHWSYAYNQEWNSFFNSEIAPSKEGAFALAKQLSEKYGFVIYFGDEQ